MNFLELAQDFSAIEETASRLKMIEILGDLFAKADPKEAQVIAYLAEGVLRPSYTGSQFNMGSKNLLAVVAQLLNKTVSEIKELAKNYPDLGELLFQQYKKDILVEPNIEYVYDKLVELENIAGTGSVELRIDYLVKLLGQLSPLEAKYVLRIVSGTLRLGFSIMTILDALSWMLKKDKSLRAKLERAYNNCADIGLLAYIVKKYGEDGLDQFKIKVGVPIAPAAAERIDSAQSAIDKIGPAVAQLKLDGFRLQIHLDNSHSDKEPKINFFSRNLIDMSEMFPDLVKALKKLKVDSLICEGEAIVYDDANKRFMPFQETVKRKRKHGIEETAKELPLRLYIFDILYLNGESCLDLPHEQRRQILKQILPDDSHPLYLIEEKKVNSVEELSKYFREVLAEGLEGLVIKKPLGHYIPGKRNFNWIKLKKHSKDTLSDTMDVVILGYYYGEGKRSAFGIGSFLVGVFDKSKDRFETIAKIGTGLSDEDWATLKHKCDAIKVSEPPHDVKVAEALFPDVWVRPQLVCEVKADEITKSPLHTAKYALRFPRFVGYRPDKSAYDITTNQEVERLFSLQSSEKNNAS